MQRINASFRLVALRHLLVRRGVYIGLALACCCLIVGGLAYAAGATTAGSAAVTLGVGMGLGWGVTWAIYLYTVARPLARLTDATQILADADAALLSDTLAAVAEGDLTRRLEMRAKPVDISASDEVTRLGEGIGDIIARLREGAVQLNRVTDEACQRLFYVGPDGYLQGQTCGDAMGRALNGKGQVLVVTASFHHIGLEIRRKGFEGILRERYPGVEIVEAVESIGEGSIMRDVTAAALKRHPRVAGIYVTVTGGGAAWAVADAGLAGKMTIICHDLVDEAMPYVIKGVITAAISQDPFGQGHDPVIHLFNHLVAGWQPPESRMLTAMDMVTASNVGQFWQTGKGAIESEAIAERRPKPIKVAAKRIRIAVLGLTDAQFWQSVRVGVVAADEELRAFNAEAEWIVPEPSGSFDLRIRSEAIERLARDGYDAIATMIMDTGLVETINRVVAAGVPVATFNSESSSLRGLMDQLSHRATKLMSVSGGLAGSAHWRGASRWPGWRRRP